MAGAKYVVLQPLKHDGQRLKPDDLVELSAKDAAPLVAAGILMPGVDEAAKAEAEAAEAEAEARRVAEAEAAEAEAEAQRRAEPAPHKSKHHKP